MAEEKPSLHIDLDWKKQAQEEKKRLEEAEQQRKEEAARPAVTPAGAVPTITGAAAALDSQAAASAAPGAPAAATPGRRAQRGDRTSRELPQASVQTLVNTLVTQTLLYLGELSTSTGQDMLNLDMAKHQLDTLNVIEEKTAGNLTPEEQEYLDLALYETRTRFISVSGQIIAGAA